MLGNALNEMTEKHRTFFHLHVLGELVLFYKLSLKKRSHWPVRCIYAEAVFTMLISA